MTAAAKKQEVVTVEAAPPATQDGGAMALLRAGASPEQIEKLMILQERWEASQARKAFNEAVAKAKAEIKPILRTQQGHNSKYADLAAIADSIDPILSRHGLGYRHRSSQSEKMITVACILFHELGHSEETPLEASPDTSGSKNSIQAIGSTLTYLQRYSLVLALGLATAKDDDAKSAGNGEIITDAQADTLKSLTVEVGANIQLFYKYMTKACGYQIAQIEDIQAKDYDKAVKALEAKRAKQ